MLDFTLLTPALSNRRGSLVLLQLIVFIMRKSCLDTCALGVSITLGLLCCLTATFIVAPAIGQLLDYKRKP